MKIIIVVLAVLALFYFDAKEFNGNHNQLSFGEFDRYRHYAAGAVLHRQILAGPDRGQVNATPKDRVNHQPQDHRGAVDAGAIQRMAQIRWRTVAAEVPD